MRKLLFAILLVFVIPFTIKAQLSFTEIDLGLPGSTDGSIEVGDFNNDGFLDFIVIGEGTTWLYSNNGDLTFSLINSGLPGIYNGSAKWGNYDRDNYIDLLIVGDDQLSVFKNNKDSTFTEIPLYTNEFNEAYASWIDVENDGDLDVIAFIYNLTDDEGNDDEDAISLFYKRDFEIDINGDYTADSIVNNNTELFHSYNTETTISDINNDGYSDVLLTGKDISSNNHTTLLKNNKDGTFINLNIDFDRGSNSIVKFFDLNADGYDDIYYADDDTVLIYKNNKDETFMKLNPNIQPGLNSTIKTTDLNNDGSDDLIFTKNDSTTIYINEGNETFTIISSSITQGTNKYVCYGDFDKDNDSDLIILNETDIKLYKNDIAVANTPPTAPQNLSITVLANNIILSWDRSSDTESLSSSIEYVYYLTQGPRYEAWEILHTSVIDTNSTSLKILNSEMHLKDTFLYVNNITAYDALEPEEEDYFYIEVQAIDNGSLISEKSVSYPFYIADLFGWGSSERYSSCINSSGYAIDFDNDNIQDIIQSGSGYTEIMFRGDPNNYLSIWDFFGDGYDYTAMDYLDIDNNSFIDIILAGVDNDDLLNTNLYINNGDSTFSNLSLNFENIHNGRLKFSDIDNDGDQDLFICGDTLFELGNKPISKLYINNGDYTFEEANVNFIKVSNSLLAISDYNNDGMYDIFLSGLNENGTVVSMLYKNNGNLSFDEVPTTIISLFNGDAKWADFDDDNDMDLIVTGYNEFYDNVTKIYKNQENDVFLDINANLRGAHGSSVAWGDYDNDGFLDLALIGNSGHKIAKVYRNENGNSFSELISTPKQNLGYLNGFENGWLTWFHIDNDSDLDLFLNGDPFDPGILPLYNNQNNPNSLPEAPTTLIAENSGYGVKLKWYKAYDEQSSDGLYYNVRIGTTPSGIDIMNPLADVVTGKLRVSMYMGNVQCNTSWHLDSLPAGTYYWSVQAIDQSWSGGAWADEQIFEIFVLNPDFETDTVCNGMFTTFQNNSVSSGDPINSWTWDFGDGSTSTEQNPTHTFTISGNYSVKLKVSNGTYTDSITKPVIVKKTPICNFETDTVCIGSETTIINSTDANGLTITSWQWDFDDENSSNVQNPGTHGYLNAGSYNVELIALADNKCYDTIIKEVLVGAIPNSSVTLSGDNSFCEDESLILSVEYGSGYNYLWKFNANNIDGETNDSLIIYSNSGEYSVEVTNSIGNCISTSAAIPITINPNPVVAINGLNHIYTLTSDPVLVNVEPIGGLLSGNGVTSFDNMFHPDMAEIGFHEISYIYTDMNGCQGADTAIVDIVVIAGIIEGTKDIYCYTDQIDIITGYNLFSDDLGSFYLGDENGRTPLSMFNNYAAIDPSFLGPGIDTIIYEFWDGIKFTVKKVITIDSVGIVDFQTLDQEYCNNQNPILLTAVGLYPPNGVGLFSSSSSGLINNYDNTAYLNPQNVPEDDLGVEFNINYVYESPNGCFSDTVSKSVTIYDLPEIYDISGDNNYCANVNGITINLSNSNSNVHYQLKKNGVNEELAINGTGNALTWENKTAGIYSVVGNIQSCTSTMNGSINVTETPLPIRYNLSTEDNTYCKGETGVSITLNGSEIGVEYQLMKNGIDTTDAKSGNGTNLIWNGLPIGTYTVVANQNTSCSSTMYGSIEVTEDDLPLISINDAEICEGEEYTLSANLGFANYAWSTGVSGNEANAQSINVSIANNYSVTVTDVNGCENSGTMTLILKALPSQLNSSDVSVCFGETNPAIVAEGTDINWYADGELENLLTSSANYYSSEINVGTYNYYVTQTIDNCESKADTVAFTIDPVPSKQTISSDGPVSFCNGDSVILSVPFDQSNTYQWKNEFGDIQNQNTNQLKVFDNGNYFLEITNSNHCYSYTDTIFVSTNSVPNSPDIYTLDPISFCFGNDAILETEFLEELNYQWKKDELNVGTNNYTYTASLEGTYSLVVTNENNCSAKSTNEIVIEHFEMPIQPIIEIDGNTAFCSGDSVLLSFADTAGYSSSWMRYDIPITNNSSQIYAKQAGDYSLQVTNEFGCSSVSTNTIEVINFDAPNPVSITYDATDICEGETATLEVTLQDNCNYKWYNNNEAIEGETNNQCIVNNTGLYKVVINNDNNCSYTANTVEVKVSEIPDMQNILASGDTNICPGESIQLSVTENENYNFQWKLDGINISDANTNQILASNEGIYTVLIANTENENCAITTPTKEIIIKPALPKPDLYAQGPDMWILACSNDSAQNYRWFYNGENISGANDFIYMANQQLGEYFVSINDGGECYVPSDIITIPLSATDMKALDIFGHIKIYPNPTPGTFTIKMDNEIIGTLYIRINNASARELFNIKHNKTTRHFQTQMDLSGQGKGMYFIELRFKDDKTVKKLIVE
jgi:PKD repeat protein